MHIGSYRQCRVQLSWFETLLTLSTASRANLKDSCRPPRVSKSQVVKSTRALFPFIAEMWEMSQHLVVASCELTKRLLGDFHQEKLL